MTTVNATQEVISAEQELKNKKAERLQRLAQVFSRANSVLTSRKINVHVVDVPQKQAPAWSGASDVYFNMAQVRDEFDAQSLLSLQGLNFHELAHVRYTPRNGSEICRWVIDEDKWQAFNALEDMRIESLLVSRFPSVASWLTATVLDYLVREPKALDTLFALVRGRKYLPVELRALARQNYVNQNDINELVDVIDNYRVLLFPADTEVAKELITRFHNLLQNLPLQEQQGGVNGDGETITVQVRLNDPHGHATRGTQGLESSNSRPASKEEQEQDRNNLKKQEQQDEADVVSKQPDTVVDVDVDEEGNFSFPTSDDKPSTEPSTEPSDEDFDESDLFGDEFGDLFSDEFGDEPSDTNGGNGSSQSNGDDVTKTEAITEQIGDMLESIVDELSKEIDRLSIQVNGSPILGTTGSKTPNRADFTDKPVTPELNLVAKSFGKELERLKAKHDPAWNKYVDSGRFNVVRYLDKSHDFDELFDEWQEGRDDVTAIEAVICLDYSGSMSGKNATNAYQSMWAIKKALEKVNARTTVILFDEEAKVLYGADEKAGTTIRDGGTAGGTDPEEALLFAQNVLATTEQPIRILFMITDGLWENKVADKAVQQMKSAGVLTCQSLIGFGGYSKDMLENNRHSFELLSAVDTAKDVLSLGKDLVRLAIARQLTTR